MCLDESQDDINAALFERVSLFQHLIGFPYASRWADVDLKAPAFCTFNEFEKILRAWALEVHLRDLSVFRDTVSRNSLACDTKTIHRYWCSERYKRRLPTSWMLRFAS